MSHRSVLPLTKNGHSCIPVFIASVPSNDFNMKLFLMFHFTPCQIALFMVNNHECNICLHDVLLSAKLLKNAVIAVWKIKIV